MLAGHFYSYAREQNLGISFITSFSFIFLSTRQETKMNFVRVTNLATLRPYAKGIAIGRRRPGASVCINAKRPLSTCLSRSVAISPSREPTNSLIFRRHYAINEEKVEEVTSLDDVGEVEAELRRMISEGSDIASTIERQNEGIKVGSELMIRGVYDSLVDVSIQLIIKTYPGGPGGLIQSASHAYASFPPGIEWWMNQVCDALKEHATSYVHQSTLNDAVENTTRLFKLVETAHYELGQLYNDHHETVSPLHAQTEKWREIM
jgi:hypothetical protein